jgi:hypothetical protein
MRRSVPPRRIAAYVAALFMAAAGMVGVPGIGADLVAQQGSGRRQAPQQPPAMDRSMFSDPRGPYLPPEVLRATAGRFPFYWTRAAYSDGYGGFRGGGSWAIDYPKSDQQFLIVIKRLMRLNAYDWENPVALSDPQIRKYPLIYMLEVGRMYMTEAEVEGLRGYMEAGGFVIVDDFWGPRAWDNFLWNMRRVFPDKTIVDIGLDHPIYSAYYNIEEVVQVPAYGNEIRRTECTGCYPQVKGMYDDDGRLMMMINFNTDLGDAWEWAEQPSYPLEFSTYAYQMGANMIVYAMTH